MPKFIKISIRNQDKKYTKNSDFFIDEYATIKAQNYIYVEVEGTTNIKAIFLIKR